MDIATQRTEAYALIDALPEDSLTLVVSLMRKLAGCVQPLTNTQQSKDATDKLNAFHELEAMRSKIAQYGPFEYETDRAAALEEKFGSFGDQHMNKPVSVLIDTNVVYTYLTEREDVYLYDIQENHISLCNGEDKRLYCIPYPVEYLVHSTQKSFYDSSIMAFKDLSNTHCCGGIALGRS